MAHHRKLTPFLEEYDPTDESTIERLLQSCRSDPEIREMISYLIEHRDLVSKAQLDQLEQEAAGLLKRLQELGGEAMIEEIRCFKDILALHKKQLNGPRER